MKWNEWLETNELKWSNWFEWIELNEWNDWLDMNELTWRSGNKTRQCFAISMWNRALATVSWTFCRPHLQKSGKQPTVFDNFCVINYLMTMWSTDEMTLSLQSRAHYLSTSWSTSSSKKWSEAVSSFYDSYVKSSSRYSLVRILSTTFRIEARNRGNRHPPAATTDSHFTRKKHRVLRPRVFSAVNSRVPDRSYFPTVWWPCDWHDDVVDMMMWLTWWCDSKLRESFVTRKFPNYTSFDNDE